MPGKHMIDVEELSDWVSKERDEWRRLASSYGRDSDKTLDFQIGHVAPVYRVRGFGRDIYIGALRETAVREYNALP